MNNFAESQHLQMFPQVAAIVALNAIGLGCATDCTRVRAHLRHPASLGLAVCCQLLVMPVVSTIRAPAIL